MDKIAAQNLTNRIFTLRNISIMLDRDIAELFQIPTKRVNELLKRNVNRFPEHYFFKITTEEKKGLVANCDRLKPLKHSNYLPFAFTEHGVAMLATLVKSDIAAQISIGIIDAFVQMRKNNLSINLISQNIIGLLDKTNSHEKKINWLMEKFDLSKPKQQGIFFNDQIFDAYVFSSEIISSAKKSIVLIDNFIDETTLLQLSKRKDKVSCIIYTEKVSPQLNLDLEKHNAQFSPIEIRKIKHVHDRFLIIDNQTLYHLGASLKDLGKRWFAFSRMDGILEDVLKRLV